MLRLRSQSVRRYRVVGDLPSPYDAAFAERLRERRFRPLAPHEERSHGWVAAHNLLVTRFDVDTLVRGEHVAFALRIDQRRVPPRLLKAHLELELGARVDASAAAVPEGGRPARVGREERRALREEIHKRLLLETPPSVQTHAVLLDPRRRVAYVQSLSRRVNEQVQLLFTDTFGVELSALTPWRRAQEIVAGTDLAAALDDVRRTELGSLTAGAVPVARRAAAPQGGRLDAQEVLP